MSIALRALIIWPRVNFVSILFFLLSIRFILADWIVYFAYLFWPRYSHCHRISIANTRFAKLALGIGHFVILFVIKYKISLYFLSMSGWAILIFSPIVRIKCHSSRIESRKLIDLWWFYWQITVDHHPIHIRFGSTIEGNYHQFWAFQSQFGIHTNHEMNFELLKFLQVFHSKCAHSLAFELAIFAYLNRKIWVALIIFKYVPPIQGEQILGKFFLNKSESTTADAHVYSHVRYSMRRFTELE